MNTKVSNLIFYVS